MGTATGNTERAETLAALYTAKPADIMRRIVNVPSRPRVYIEIGRGGPGVVDSTFWTSMWGSPTTRSQPAGPAMAVNSS